jgi:hypothetical protein
LALLDFVAHADEEHATDSSHTAILLRSRLLQVVAYLYSLRPSGLVAASAEELSWAALSAASQELCISLATGPCEYNANLMVPVSSSGGKAELGAFSGMAAAERASTVWSAVPEVERCLLVAAETEQAGHLGFWVPLARGNRGEYLPGAPAAFMGMSGTAVFKNDLPDLTGFPKEVNAAWGEYMHRHFKQDLFISIPYFVPMPNGIGTKVAAILNVNVQSQNESWCRAYHKEWLDIATRRLAPFIELALYATLVRAEAARRNGDGYVELDTGALTWNNLPGVQVERLIEGSDNEPRK